MINFLEIIFNYLEKLILIIRKPSGIFDLSYGGVCIVGLVLLNSMIGNKFIGMSISILLPVIIYLAFFDQYFKPFTHKAFICGIIYLSFFTNLMMSFLAQVAISFELLCISSAIFAICWFTYHIVTERTALSKIKVRLKFYLALGSTLSFFLLLSTFDMSFLKTAVASLLGSFAWVNYLIEAFEYKSHNTESQG